MAEETAIVLGLGIVFFGLAWISFKLNESDSDLSKYVGMMFLALSIAVLQIVGLTAIDIADQSVNVAVSGGVVTPVVWVLNIALFVYWLSLLLRVFAFFAMTIIHVLRKHFGGEVM